MSQKTRGKPLYNRSENDGNSHIKDKYHLSLFGRQPCRSRWPMIPHKAILFLLSLFLPSSVSCPSQAILSLKSALSDLKLAFWAAVPKGTKSCRTQGDFRLFVPPSQASQASSQASVISNQASLASNPAFQASNLASEAPYQPLRAQISPLTLWISPLWP